MPDRPLGLVSNRNETGCRIMAAGMCPAQRKPMAGMVVLTTVTVGGRQYDLMAHQRSRALWIARGEFNGQPLEGTGRSPSAAAHDWREKARHDRSMCNKAVGSWFRHCQRLHSVPRARSVIGGACGRARSCCVISAEASLRRAGHGGASVTLWMRQITLPTSSATRTPP
jgi:hypothetical protein